MLTFKFPTFVPQCGCSPSSRWRRLQVFVALCAVGLLSVAEVASAQVAGSIVLRVNDQIATALDYQNQLLDRLQAIRMAEMPEEQRQELLTDAGPQIFREIYEDLLLRSRAHQLGFFASEAEIDAAVESSKQRMGITNDDDMAKALAASGMTLEQLRRKTRDSMLVQQVVGREVRSKIEIEDDVLRQIYRDRQEELTIPAARLVEEVVVLSEVTPAKADRDAMIADLLATVSEGSPFDDVVAVFAENGETSGVIDLGWVEPGHLASDLDGVVWSLSLGEFSEPVESRGGTHVLRVLEFRDEVIRPFDDVREQILANERDRRMGDAYKEYVRDLEADAYIQMQVPEQAGEFRGLRAE